MTQSVGPPVRVWMKPVHGHPTAIVMRYDETCPSCGASWADPFSVRIGGGSVGASFYCNTCRVMHPEQRETGPATHEG